MLDSCDRHNWDMFYNNIKNYSRVDILGIFQDICLQIVSELSNQVIFDKYVPTNYLGQKSMIFLQKFQNNVLLQFAHSKMQVQFYIKTFEYNLCPFLKGEEKIIMHKLIIRWRIAYKLYFVYFSDPSNFPLRGHH